MYTWLLTPASQGGYGASEVVLMGDSAGGGLSTALTLCLVRLQRLGHASLAELVLACEAAARALKDASASSAATAASSSALLLAQQQQQQQTQPQQQQQQQLPFSNFAGPSVRPAALSSGGHVPESTSTSLLDTMNLLHVVPSGARACVCASVPAACTHAACELRASITARFRCCC